MSNAIKSEWSHIRRTKTGATFNQYLIQHNLKLSSYTIRLYSLIYYLECVRLSIYTEYSIKEFLNQLTYDKANDIMIGCVAGLSQGGKSLIERLSQSENTQVNYENYYNNTIENNSLKIFDYLISYNERNPDGIILDNYYIQGINGNLDKQIRRTQTGA